MVTDLHVLNIKGTKIQRAIRVGNILGLTKSTDSQCGEFVIHVQDDYDYRFTTTAILRDEMFETIKKVYFSRKKKNVPVYGVGFGSLKDFCTSKD